MTVVSYKHLALIPLALSGGVGVYLLPLLVEFAHPRLYSQLAEWRGEGWGVPFLRASLFAIISSTAEVLLGFLGALLIRKASRPVGRSLVLLLGPALIGSVAVGFLVKLNLMKYPAIAGLVAERNFVATWSLMLAVQCWQYLPMNLYLFWLHLQAVPENVESFGTAARLRGPELVRDLYWPHCRNLAVLLALFGVLVGLQEYSKFHLVLRSSPGTRTELAGHRLLRYYNSLVSVDPVLATERTLAYCAIYIGVGLPTAACAVALTARGGALVMNAFGRLPLPRLPGRRTADIVAVAVQMANAIPILVLADYACRRHFIAPDRFVRSVALTLLALVVVLPTAVMFGIAARLAWLDRLERFDRRSLPFFAGVLLLLFIPPIGLTFCGYRWLAELGASLQSPPLVSLTWLIGQSILAFPLLASFVQYNFFRVPTAEIQLQQAVGASLVEVARVSFLSRFRLEFLLVGLFGFSIIWTEATFNAIMVSLTRAIPSVAVELTNRVEGRSNAYFEAANLIVVSLLPISLGMFLWTAAREWQAPAR